MNSQQWSLVTALIIVFAIIASVGLCNIGRVYKRIQTGTICLFIRQ